MVASNTLQRYPETFDLAASAVNGALRGATVEGVDMFAEARFRDGHDGGRGRGGVGVGAGVFARGSVYVLCYYCLHETWGKSFRCFFYIGMVLLVSPCRLLLFLVSDSNTSHWMEPGTSIQCPQPPLPCRNRSVKGNPTLQV